MARKINGHSSIQQVKIAFRQDFGLDITDEQAKEVRAACKRGAVTWRAEEIDPWDGHVITEASYISVRPMDDIQQASAHGVHFGGYKVFYRTAEWNAAINSDNPPTW